MDAGSEWADDIFVSETIEVGREPGKRLRRTAEEKLRIVEATLVAGSVDSASGA
jgi:hypothetical protein